MTNTQTTDELSTLAQNLLTEGVKDLERKYYGEAQAKFLGSSAAATLALLRTHTGHDGRDEKPQTLAQFLIGENHPPDPTPVST